MKRRRRKDELPCIDSIWLRRQGMLPKTVVVADLDWPRWHLHGRMTLPEYEGDGKRTMHLEFRLHDEPPFSITLGMVGDPVADDWTGNKKDMLWRVGCPQCGRARCNALFIDGGAKRIGCYRCLGLTNSRKAELNKEVNRVRRDPKAWVESRAHMTSEKSRLRTARYLLLAMVTKPSKRAARRGKE